MDIIATQILSSDDDSEHNLIDGYDPLAKRVRQVGSLCIGDKKYPVFEGINTVGRHPTCDIILDDVTISKNHAEIEGGPKTAFVCDLRSSNKTRLNDEILRPMRFYQVADMAKITFGIVNAQYLFLRDVNNSIIVPETPTPIKKRCLTNICEKKLNKSLICPSDDDSIVLSTQHQDNDQVFVVPSPKRSSLKVVNRNIQENFKPMKTNIHDCDTQSVELETTNVNSNKCIHDIVTQQMDIESNESDKNKKNISNVEFSSADVIIANDDIYTAQTQSFISDAKASSNMDQYEMNRNIEVMKKTRDVNNEMKNKKKKECSNAIASRNISRHIIDESEDESETDEEGVFSNIDSTHIKNISNNKIAETDSETDEDGEFTSLEPIIPPISFNVDEKIPEKENASDDIVNKRISTSNRESPCLNERLSHQYSVLNSEIVNSNENNDPTAQNFVAPTKNDDSDLSNKNDNSDDDDDDMPLIFKLNRRRKRESVNSRKSIKSVKSSNTTTTSHSDEDDDDMIPTQIIENPKTRKSCEELIKVKKVSDNVSNDEYGTLNLNDDTDNIPTQKVDVEMAKITTKTRFKAAETILNETNDEINMGIMTASSPVKKSRISLRLQRNMKTSTPIVEKQLNKSDSLNDSISKNLVSLFGEEDASESIVEAAPIATQQLQDILEQPDKKSKKRVKQRASNKLNDDLDNSDSVKKNSTLSRYDTIIENKNFVYSAGTSGFKEGVAVFSEEKVGVSESPMKKKPRNSNKAIEAKAIIVTDDVKEDVDGKNDIFKDVSESQKYGTASCSASPTSFVCSLDDCVPLENKRKDTLKRKSIKKPTNTSNLVSSPDEKRMKASIAANTLIKKIKDIKKVLESSDDEELNFDDLKKMAADFIATDTRTKNLSIKLEKIPDANDYRSIVHDAMKEQSVSPNEKPRMSQGRKRGRPKKNISTCSSVLQDDKFHSDISNKNTDEIPSTKLVHSPDTSSGSLLSKPKKLKSSVIDPLCFENRLRTQHKVLFTGIYSQDFAAEVKQCGGVITDIPNQATILVTDKIRRTNKFFCAISKHIPIVTIKWIEDSAKNNSFLDSNDYILKDPVAEAKYKFDLGESLERATRKKLLDGFTFIITKNVNQPTVDEIRSMIQISGGKSLIRPPKLWLPNTIIISCHEDASIVEILLSKAPKNLEIPVFTTEFILSGILKQELNFNANKMILF